jgi:AcrR family transcriptional regulator
MSDDPNQLAAALPEVRRRTRLSPEMRKARIAEAAAEIFARAGFAGTGFRDIALASQTSEALVYRYFPTKQALWNAALQTVRNNAASQFILQGQNGKPSTALLVELTVELARRFLSPADDVQPQNRETLNRMLLRSLSEDGEFAGSMLGTIDTALSRLLVECLHVARAAGDMVASDTDDEAFIRLYFNLFFVISSMQMHGLVDPQRLPGNVGATIYNLVEFQLRGVGLRPDVIARELVRLRAMYSRAGTGSNTDG